MNSIFVALTSVLIAVSIGTVLLYKYERRFRLKGQSFRFHELRDKLQLLAIEGKIDQKSDLYEFLLFTINLSIKNAGLMKLSQLLGMSSAIDRKINANATGQMFEEIRRHNEEVQQLSADVFSSLAKMLISNDRVIYLLVKTAEISTHSVEGAARNAIKTVARTIMPDHSKALSAVLNYRQWGNSLNLQLHHTGG